MKKIDEENLVIDRQDNCLRIEILGKPGVSPADVNHMTYVESDSDIDEWIKCFSGSSQIGKPILICKNESKVTWSPSDGIAELGKILVELFKT